MPSRWLVAVCTRHGGSNASGDTYGAAEALPGRLGGCALSRATPRCGARTAWRGLWPWLPGCIPSAARPVAFTAPVVPWLCFRLPAHAASAASRRSPCRARWLAGCPLRDAFVSDRLECEVEPATAAHRAKLHGRPMLSEGFRLLRGSSHPQGHGFITTAACCLHTQPACQKSMIWSSRVSKPGCRLPDAPQAAFP